VIRLKLDQIRKTHREVFEGLREAGIGVNLHYIPVHTQLYYQNLGFQNGDFPESESYYREAISLPMFQGLTNAQQDEVVEALKRVVLS
jgi:dTDP-4-amino-4,6-dideoxygalactose transaminase